MIEKNSPSAISRSRRCTATRSPKRFAHVVQRAALTLSRPRYDVEAAGAAPRSAGSGPAVANIDHGEAHEADGQQHDEHADGVDLGRQAEADQPEEHDRQRRRAPVPCRKNDVTTSSNENVNASSPATTIAGISERQRDAPEDAPRGRTEIGGRLLERRGRGRPSGLDDDRRVGRVPDRVADDDRGQAEPECGACTKRKKSAVANTTSGSDDARVDRARRRPPGALRDARRHQSAPETRDDERDAAPRRPR